MNQIAVTDQNPEGAVYSPLGHRPDGALYIVARTRLPPAALAAVLPGVVRRSIRAAGGRSADDGRASGREPHRPQIAGRSHGYLRGDGAAPGGARYIRRAELRRRAAAARNRDPVALGAQPRQIRRQFLAVGLRLLTIGSLLGLLGAALVGRALRSVLFDVSPIHPATLATTAFVIAGVTLAACLLPALGAARLSPTDALKDQ